jgi:hypothetical protein
LTFFNQTIETNHQKKDEVKHFISIERRRRRRRKKKDKKIFLRI